MVPLRDTKTLKTSRQQESFAKEKQCISAPVV